MIRILVIDHDEGILLLMQATLRRSNYHTLIAKTARDGVQIAQNERPDLIIVDDSMPQMPGDEFCRTLRSHDSTQHIPIIVSSAGLENRTPGYAHSLGADYVLPKPFRPQEVVEIVSRLAPQM